MTNKVIIDQGNNKTSIECAIFGTCFIYNNNCYMVTDHADDGVIYAINLADGTTMGFEPTFEFTPIFGNITLNINNSRVKRGCEIYQESLDAEENS